MTPKKKKTAAQIAKKRRYKARQEARNAAHTKACEELKRQQLAAAQLLQPPQIDTVVDTIVVTTVPDPASPGALFATIAERVPKTKSSLFAKTIRKVVDGTIDFGTRRE